MKTIALSILGNIKDFQGGNNEERWTRWRPNIGLVQQKDLPIDELHLIVNTEFQYIADVIKADIKTVSPHTKVIFEPVVIKDAWDFEEIYTLFADLAREPFLHSDSAEYYIHISTGSHVEQICLFLLAESHQIRAKLVQTIPPERHDTTSDRTDTRGSISIIDLDLARYDKLARRFEAERQDDLAFLKRGIATRNSKFNHLIETIERVAVRTVDPILLTGPTGAGKSQLAEQIYKLKKQNGQVTGKFVSVNCATLGGSLATSALFGYKKGAFTGAVADHGGFLKEADKGILFLDEIGELPLEAQAMLLTALETGSFRPLGGSEDDHSDFELICGTNRNLRRLSSPRTAPAGKAEFREDLLARINLWSFRLPGLAERRDDIEPNLEFELARYARRTGKHVSFNREALRTFLEYALDPTTAWRGNFRDLAAMITRMATLADGGRITKDLVLEEIRRISDELESEEQGTDSPQADNLGALLGDDYETRFDPFDLAQLSYVVSICRRSDNAAQASKTIFAVSRQEKSTANDSDRLIKYLKRFNLKFSDLKSDPSPRPPFPSHV